MLLSFKPTPSPNLHIFISFLFSISCSNAYVESVFSIMKHLYDDKRNRMSTEPIAAELKIRLNSSFLRTEAYDFFLSKPELLKLIHSNGKYCFKKQRVIWYPNVCFLGVVINWVNYILIFIFIFWLQYILWKWRTTLFIIWLKKSTLSR